MEPIENQNDAASMADGKRLLDTAKLKDPCDEQVFRGNELWCLKQASRRNRKTRIKNNGR